MFEDTVLYHGHCPLELLVLGQFLLGGCCFVVVSLLSTIAQMHEFLNEFVGAVGISVHCCGLLAGFMFFSERVFSVVG
ncbi:MAG: hypothetical protein IJR24_01555 [Alloprevotella sp.]|nr:hypothetical protein [Alloprevotella sp.]